MRNSLPHTSSARTGEQISFRDTRTRDSGNSRNTLPHTLPHTSSARTGEHLLFQDTHTRDQDDDFRDTRNREQDDVRDTRTLQFRLDDRPTHDDNKRNSAEAHSNSSFSRPSSSPKVPTFDGSNTAQFRPWIIQFEAIAEPSGLDSRGTGRPPGLLADGSSRKPVNWNDARSAG